VGRLHKLNPADPTHHELESTWFLNPFEAYKVGENPASKFALLSHSACTALHAGGHHTALHGAVFDALHQGVVGGLYSC
jgi:hypothetical protein